MNGDKNLMNPYLPPLDGTDSENAQRFVENSPKILYACQAIAKMLKHAAIKVSMLMLDQMQLWGR